MTSLKVLTVFDYDGILGLLNVDTYASTVEWTQLDPDLIDHFAAERDSGHALVWQTSSLGGDEFTVEFVDAASARTCFRELNAMIEVTTGRLHLVHYTDLTMAAEGDDEAPLPSSLGEEWFVKLENGRYGVTVRQLFDPESELAATQELSFEVVLARDVEVPASTSDELFWRAPL